MKKVVLSILIISIVAAISGCKKDSLELSLSETHIEGYPTTLADYKFAELVEKRTDGRIKIQIHSGASLYLEESQTVKALQEGTLAFARISCSPLGEAVSKINLIQLPYLYKNGEHMWKVLNGKIGNQILEEIETSGSGLIGLCYYDSGARSFYLRKPVYNVEDMKGLKIRIQSNTMMADLISLLGAESVKGIGAGQVYDALQNEIIDGAENNWPTYQNMGDYNVAPYYILDEHTRVPDILIGSVKALKKISKADLEIIKQCAKETQEYEIEKWREKEKEAEKIVREAGCKVIDLTEEQIAGFEAKMNPIYEKYAARNEELIDAIKAEANQ